MAFVFSHPQPASLIITTVDQTENGAAYLAVPDHDTQARGRRRGHRRDGARVSMNGSRARRHPRGNEAGPAAAVERGTGEVALTFTQAVRAASHRVSVCWKGTGLSPGIVVVVDEDEH